MIWSGVHRTFSDVPTGGDAFVHPQWVDKSIVRLESAISRSDALPSAEYPVAAAVVGAWDGATAVTVLDIGGNLGQLAPDVQRRLPGIPTAWTVLERDDLLSEVRKRISLPSSVKFCTSLADLQGERFDVLHFGSVLQYFEDWREELTLICTAHATPTAWIAISDAMVGKDIESFVTRQAYYERNLVMHFLNLGELLEHLESLHFGLMLLEPYLTPHTRSYYPEPDLPAERRIPHPLNMVFRRTG